MPPAGCIKVKGIGFRPKVSAKSSALVQPQRIGGHTIFESKQVVVDSPLSRIVTGMQLIFEAWHHGQGLKSSSVFTCSVAHPVKLHGAAGHHFDCIVSEPWLDWTAEEDGDSRLVRLLKVQRCVLDPCPTCGLSSSCIQELTSTTNSTLLDQSLLGAGG